MVQHTSDCEREIAVRGAEMEQAELRDQANLNKIHALEIEMAQVKQERDE